MRSVSDVSVTNFDYTVVIVEQGSVNRALYRRLLLADSTCRYRVVEAESVLETAMLCRSRRIDGILIDDTSSDGVGLETVRELQHQLHGNSPPLVSPPIVMVTNQSDPATVVRAIKLGVEDYLIQQTLTSEQLQIAMRSAIENARLRLELQHQEERFRVSVENMLDCFGCFSAIRDEHGQIVDFRIDYLNKPACDNNRMSREEQIGKRLCELLPAHRETGLFDEYCRVVETGQPLVKESLIYDDSYAGQHLVRAFDIHATKLDDGFVASWRDVTDRKRLELELTQRVVDLQQEQQRLQQLIDHAPIGIGIGTARGEVKVINDEMLRLHGYTRDEFEHQGMNWRTFTSPELYPSVDEAMARLQREGTLPPEEKELVRRDGSRMPVWISLMQWLDGTGEHVAFAVDLTRQKQAEAAIQNLNQDLNDRITELQTLIEMLPIGIAIATNPSGQQMQDNAYLKLGMQVAGIGLARVDYALNQVVLSEQAAALFGLANDERLVSRDRLHAAFHPEDWAALADLIEQVLDPAGAGWFTREHRVIWPNGEVRWLNVRKQVFFDRSGATPRPNYAILAAVDVTARKQTETALQESETRLRLMTELSPQILWTAQPDGSLDYFNQRWEEFAGVPMTDTLGWRWQPVIHPEDELKTVELWTQAVQFGQPYECEHRVQRADGEYRWLLSRALPLRDAEGRIVKWFGSATDVHDVKQLEVERTQLLAVAESARLEAEAANRSKDEFISLVAHELRSPLNAILGWTKLLQTRELDGATTRKALHTIVRNTQIQVQLVEDLLDISRIERGSLPLEFALVNVMDIVEAAIETVNLPIRDKLLQLTTQLQPVTTIWGDYNRLQQVVINLLTNSIKFTPDGGCIQIQLQQDKASVQIQVSDTGKGISPDFLPHIFERFRQDQQNATVKQGLGLGLAIVKYIVEQHGGTITAHSGGEGRGATFTIRLPLLPVATPGRTSAEPEFVPPAQVHPTAPVLAEVRILLVDDNVDMLDLTTLILQQAGAVVQIATGAVSALQHLPIFRPDVLISDIAMPEHNGYELLQWVRSQYPEWSIPAIALTAYASETQVEDSLQAGFEQHLTKPVEPEVLISTILNVIHRRGA